VFTPYRRILIGIYLAVAFVAARVGAYSLFVKVTGGFGLSVSCLLRKRRARVSTSVSLNAVPRVDMAACIPTWSAALVR
jgi:hypothetical protein